MSSLRKVVLGRGAKRYLGGLRECTPIPWSKYFENERDVAVEESTFHVYQRGHTGPVLVTVHGGGYSALTWALFAEEITNKIDCQVLSVDLRGHGNTRTINDADLALETLAKDVVAVVEAVYGETAPVVLVGHSLGGAVVVEAARRMKVVGMCVIDVVEGTALESLSSMQNILRGRPASFNTIEQAIQWSFRSGQTHNLEAARISMPGQIKNSVTDQLAANEKHPITTEDHGDEGQDRLKVQKLLPHKAADAIEEEPEHEHDKSEPNSENRCVTIEMTDAKPPLPINKSLNVFKEPIELNAYTWRIDLSKTESFWMGWFKGLSHKFLEVDAPKVLILANIHGLDTTLTVGQMQGKFQFQVLSRSGHAIHEDQPQQVADILAGFLVKQRLAVAKGGFTPIMPAC